MLSITLYIRTSIKNHFFLFINELKKLFKMGKNRYYCDFCDRSFKDNVVQRKKHLSSTVHKQYRDAYYQQFKGLIEFYRTLFM